MAKLKFLKFGELYKLRGIVYYRLSPYELRSWVGFVSKGIPKLYNYHFKGTYIYMFPGFTLYFALWENFKVNQNKAIRKNPEDYINDV